MNQMYRSSTCRGHATFKVCWRAVLHSVSATSSGIFLAFFSSVTPRYSALPGLGGMMKPKVERTKRKVERTKGKVERTRPNVERTSPNVEGYTIAHPRRPHNARSQREHDFAAKARPDWPSTAGNEATLRVASTPSCSELPPRAVIEALLLQTCRQRQASKLVTAATYCHRGSSSPDLPPEAGIDAPWP